MPESESTRTPPNVEGAHLVGSVRLEDAEAVFRAASERLGDHLERITDGETGERFHWLLFQGRVFEATPGLERVGEAPVDLAGFDVRPFALAEGVEPAEVVFPELGYAAAARDSYARFRRLRDEGAIRPGTRFQVSLPTPVATVQVFVAPPQREALEPAYEAAMLRELARIVEAIPAEDLAIQWDMAVEFALLEGADLGGGPAEAWFGDALRGSVERAARLGDVVPEGAQLGYHLCYGDVGEAHFVEPKDAGNLVRVANALFERIDRRVDFLHLPVPIERDDDAYYAPLADLRLPQGTKLYLGLVHREDGVEGARRRIEAAGRVVPAFGVATECGFGRGPVESMEPLLDLHAEVLETVGRG